MSESGAIVLRAQGVGVSYGALHGRPAFQALAGVDLELAQGECLAVVGASGSGKSTLAHAILGLVPSGRACVRGRLWIQTSHGPRELDLGDPRGFRGLRGRWLGYVPQDLEAGFDPLQSVGAQIAEALGGLSTDPGGLRGGDPRARVLELLSEVGLGASHAASLPGRLSGGERQRAALAAALALDPAVLVADEPTSALDSVRAQELLSLLDRLRRTRRVALLWISHDLRRVAAWADRVLVLDQGRAVETGKATEVLREPRHAATRELAQAFLEPAPAAPRGAVEPQELPLVQARGLGLVRRRAGWFEVQRRFELQGVDLELARGEVTALIGESGSGKSTLVRTLLGLEPATAGELTVAWGSERISLRSAGRRELARARTRLGWIPQEPGGALDPRASLLECTEEPLLAAGVGAAAARARAQALLSDCEIGAELWARRVHELSGGERQRGNLARALAQEPDVLLLDEPTASLDPPVAKRMARWVRELVQRRRLAALWVTHDVQLARALASRVVVLDGGRVVESGPAEQVLSRPASDAGRRLVDAARAAR
ncbi:MAG: ABC transporter ATP-binding protein [Planctomycetes bacterium]|nr:ABC transporter ATP-binding protein [Planctomycetota bacterium]